MKEYLVYLRDIKQVSDNTFTSYKRDLKKLVQYLHEKNISDITTVDSYFIQSYMDYLDNQGYASTTITRSFIAIKSFYKYMCDEGYVDTNPGNVIRLPKAKSNPNVVLTKEEMQALLSPPVVFSFKGLRDRAMLLVLYDTKISISELVKLKVQAVNFEESVLVCGKEGNEKIYSLRPDTKEALEVYVQYKNFSTDNWLFPNRYGDPMSRQGFWKTIKNYAKEIGIDKEITLFSIKQGEI